MKTKLVTTNGDFPVSFYYFFIIEEKQTKKMKKNIYLLFVACALIFTSCKKDESQNEPEYEVNTQSFDNSEFPDGLNDTLYFDIDQDGAMDLAQERKCTLNGSDRDYFNSVYVVNPNCGLSTYKKINGDIIDFKKGDMCSGNTEIFWCGFFTVKGGVPTQISMDEYLSGDFDYQIYGVVKIERDGETYYGWLKFEKGTITKIGIAVDPNTAIPVGQE